MAVSTISEGEYQYAIQASKYILDNLEGTQPDSEYQKSDQAATMEGSEIFSGEMANEEGNDSNQGLDTAMDQARLGKEDQINDNGQNEFTVEAPSTTQDSQQPSSIGDMCKVTKDGLQKVAKVNDKPFSA